MKEQAVAKIANPVDAQLRQEKHIELHAAIERIEHVIGHAESTLDRITGEFRERPNTKSDVPRCEPSLSEFLDRSTDEVDKYCTRLHETIDLIIAALF